MKLKLAPGKVAVKKVEAQLKGGIALPPSRAKAYDIAEITHVGPLDSFGHEGKESCKEDYKPGQIVLFQLPIHVAALATHRVKDTLNIFLSVSDIIARLDSATIDMASFHIAGRYVLVKPTVRDHGSKIIVPETATETRNESLHFSVLQKGADVTIDISIGQEVFPHKGRVNPLVVDNEEVAFVDQTYIDGVMSLD